MARKVSAVPEGYHTVTPYLVFKDSARAIAFYRKALGAEERFRMPGPDGRGVVHAEIQIGDSMIMLGDEAPGYTVRSPESVGGTTAGIFLYVQDVDAAFKRALDAGCTLKMPVTDMFWGDRYGKVTDPFGVEWGIATHKEDVPPEEMARRAKAHFAQAGGNK